MLKDAEHRHYQAAYKEHAVDHQQRPQPFGGFVLRLDRQPGKESRKRHQRIAQQVKAEKEPHLLYIIISQSNAGSTYSRINSILSLTIGLKREAMATTMFFLGLT